MKYLLTFAYNGSKFKGFERQKNVRTIQGDIEKTLSSIYNETIVIKGAGRTDAGVHALGQTAHFESDKKIKHLKYKLNKQLKNIYILKINNVSDDFHARYSVKKKVYCYVLKINHLNKSPYYLGVKNIDINKMKELSKIFIGSHDFHNFVSGKRDDYQTYIYDIKFYYLGSFLIIKFIGTGFYRYMVRKLVGALIAYSKNKVTYNEVNLMLQEPNISKELPTVISNGLYLIKVIY